jgi:hypothetical protein
MTEQSPRVPAQRSSIGAILFAEAFDKPGRGGTTSHAENGHGQPVCGQRALHWRMVEDEGTVTCEKCSRIIWPR